MAPETPSKQPGSATSALPETALAGLLNHLLGQQSWATARLRPHCGKTLLLRLPLVSTALTIQHDGNVAPAEPGVPADAILTPDPLAWLIAAAPAARFVARGADTALTQELAEILGSLRWDVEEDLSRIVGDIAAHKLVSGAAGVLGWHRNAVATIAKSWVEHWQEDSPLLAQPEQADAFCAEVAELQGRVEQLEQRIKQLSIKP